MSRPTEIIRSINCLATHGILSVENAELQWSNLDTSPPVNRVISASDVLAPVNTNSYGLGELPAFLLKIRKLQ